MKSFFQFLRETASQQAARLGLEGDGHGGWYKDGEFVAKTEKGQLKFYNKRQRVGKQDPPQSEKEKNLSAPSSAPAPEAEKQEMKPPEVEKTKGTLTVALVDSIPLPLDTRNCWILLPVTLMRMTILLFHHVVRIRKRIH